MVKIVALALAVVAIAAIWVAGTFLTWSLVLKVGLTVGVLLLVGLFFLITWLVRRAKAKALETDILRQAEQQAMAARPDRRGEMLELQLKVKRAIEALKSSRLGSKSGGALYALP